jgi:hypothetical protein
MTSISLVLTAIFHLCMLLHQLKGIYIAGVTEEYVGSVDETLNVMHVGKLRDDDDDDDDFCVVTEIVTPLSFIISHLFPFIIPPQVRPTEQ